MKQGRSGIRNRPREQFVMIRNAAMRDAQLSLKAKGLLGVMLSYPDDWTYYMRQLQEQSRDGREAHQSAMKELVVAGYVIRRRSRDERNRFDGWEYLVADYRQDTGNETPGGTKTPPKNLVPDNNSPTDGKPVSREPRQSAKPSDGKPATTKKDATKTQDTKTQSSRRAGEASAGEPMATTLEEKMQGLDKRIRTALGAQLLEELYTEDRRRKSAWAALSLERQEELFREAQAAMKEPTNSRAFRTILKEHLDDSAGISRTAAATTNEQGYEETRQARIRAANQRYEEVYVAGLDAGLSDDEADRRASQERQRVLSKLFARHDQMSHDNAHLGED